MLNTPHRMLSRTREVNMSNLRAHRNGTLKPRMDRKTASLAIVLFAVFFAFSTPAVYGQGRKSSAAADTGKSGGDVARGKYLVEGVAMCGECHTPRNSTGGLDRSRWLQGAPVRWAPLEGASNWPLIAPRIGGNPPASDADMIKLLTTGIWTTGKPLRFPMMPFRMSASDAKAVVAYLKTLTSQN
jgi:mono/diheme cytochrome c family protein